MSIITTEILIVILLILLQAAIKPARFVPQGMSALELLERLRE